MIEDQFRDVSIPEARRQWVRENLSLAQFYDDYLVADRRDRVAKKQLSASTMTKDRQALNRWAEHSRPEDWPADQPWPGLPIGRITDRYLTHVLDRMRAAGLEDPTVRSTWNHLRTMLNAAFRLRAIDRPIRPERRKPVDRKVQTYKPDEIAAAYHALAKHVDLQVAFVLGCNAGMRTSDLFRLRWENVVLTGERPSVSFVSLKTGKRQLIPLAPVTVAQLQRLTSQGRSELLFPGRTSEQAADPERSKAARTRKSDVRRALLAVGINYEKPFQVCRATCNTRLNETRGFSGAGDFVLGHSLGLNSKSYMDPSDLIVAAIHAVQQPACFSEF